MPRHLHQTNQVGRVAQLVERSLSMLSELSPLEIHLSTFFILRKVLGSIPSPSKPAVSSSPESGRSRLSFLLFFFLLLFIFWHCLNTHIIFHLVFKLFNCKIKGCPLHHIQSVTGRRCGEPEEFSRYETRLGHCLMVIWHIRVFDAFPILFPLQNKTTSLAPQHLSAEPCRHTLVPDN
ncbi:hypothetical protein B0T24DRAFT_139728 [Lasiosphaeria ovina]|uniref:Uncharacterized protein n=1 Tax=Lasiosphaeria ovina TaxID=92902 RepID=A0AAE0KME9_9PEZI|nr:hypothetical protein B0T24DRAFT_139728 [Lasiosphaeria ovina]